MLSTDQAYAICGFAYLFCWGVTAYPQIVRTHKSRSPAGGSPAFVLLNCLGFCCFLIFTLSRRYVQAQVGLVESIWQVQEYSGAAIPLLLNGNEKRILFSLVLAVVSAFTAASAGLIPYYSVDVHRRRLFDDVADAAGEDALIVVAGAAAAHSSSSNSSSAPSPAPSWSGLWASTKSSSSVSSSMPGAAVANSPSPSPSAPTDSSRAVSPSAADGREIGAQGRRLLGDDTYSAEEDEAAPAPAARVPETSAKAGDAPASPLPANPQQHPTPPQAWLPRDMPMITVLQVLGFVKVAVTAIKYPTVLLFFKRQQSTAGMHPGTFFLDMCGGIFAVSQNVVLAVSRWSVQYLLANFPKIAIGTVAIVFCAMILFVHFCTELGRNGRHHAGDDLAHGGVELARFKKVAYHELNENRLCCDGALPN